MLIVLNHRSDTLVLSPAWHLLIVRQEPTSILLVLKIFGKFLLQFFYVRNSWIQLVKMTYFQCLLRTSLVLMLFTKCFETVENVSQRTTIMHFVSFTKLSSSRIKIFSKTSCIYLQSLHSNIDGWSSSTSFFHS